MITLYWFTSLRRVSRDWETVKILSHEILHRNRIKLVKKEMMLNSQKCLITLYIVDWVIIKTVESNSVQYLLL